MFGFARGRGDGDFFGADKGVDCRGFANIRIPNKTDLCSAGVGGICGLGAICGVLEYRED